MAYAILCIIYVHEHDKHKFTLENINCVCRSKMSQKTHLAILYGSATAAAAGILHYRCHNIHTDTHQRTISSASTYPIIIITITSPHLSSDLYLCMRSNNDLYSHNEARYKYIHIYICVDKHTHFHTATPQ